MVENHILLVPKQLLGVSVQVRVAGSTLVHEGLDLGPPLSPVLLVDDLLHEPLEFVLGKHFLVLLHFDISGIPLGGEVHA